MITNKVITYYHKTFNKETKLYEWQRYTFTNTWVFGGKGNHLNRGYENANDVDVRIEMKYIDNKSIFKIGDIIVVGYFGDIEKQSDVEATEFYNVTSININDFGSQPHIHLGGK